MRLTKVLEKATFRDYKGNARLGVPSTLKKRLTRKGHFEKLATSKMCHSGQGSLRNRSFQECVSSENGSVRKMGHFGKWVISKSVTFRNLPPRQS